MNAFTWDPKLSFSDVISFFALLFSVLAIFCAQKSNRKMLQYTEVQKRNEAEKLCNEALDLMSGGESGTKALFIDFTKVAVDEESRYFERARRNIEAALNLAPNFYLCHQYFGLYTLKMDGSAVRERAEKAIPLYEKAVDLWKRDANPRVKDDGWPFHDLAVALSHSGDQANAEKYYQEALKINADTEPDFYADFAQFQLHVKKDARKCNELYEIARKIAFAGHRKSNRPDLLN